MLCCIRRRSRTPIEPIQLDPLFTIASLPPDHPNGNSWHRSFRSHLYDEDNREMSPTSQYSNLDGAEDVRKSSQSQRVEEVLDECQEQFQEEATDIEHAKDGDIQDNPPDAVPMEQIVSEAQAGLVSLSATAIPEPLPIIEPSKDLLRMNELADYERKLSVCGDDRKRGELCDIQRHNEILEEDRAAGLLVPSRRPSKRPETLMESALERTLQEKALFRASREPSFATTSGIGTSHIREDSIDPLDERRRRTMTEAPSWSRFPSHTRAIRSGPAVGDGVIARDFAMPVPYEDRSKLKRPMSSVRRYYTDLLTTTGFHGKGHRTSIWAAGKLKDPELEILPPVLPTIAEPTETPAWVQADGAGDIQYLTSMYGELVTQPYHTRGLSEKSFLRESSSDLLRLVEAEKERCERNIREGNFRVE